MKLFECQNCGHPLYFDNTKCESCGLRLGYLPARETISALQPDNEDKDLENKDLWRALASPNERYRFCLNAGYDVCNWLIRAGSSEQYCAACRHNRTIPDLSVEGNRERWRKIEVAKHRLFYTLLKLQLPLATKAEDRDGLAFDFLATPAARAGSPVMTGHDNGLITLNLAEADDAERERQRHEMGEPYRTLLGHFRHEIAHYYWSQLIAESDRIGEFRDLFGDERKDYVAALQEHYAKGAPPDWPAHYVTAYASSHPWEDFAETWAHYFHMIDTLETAAAFGVSLRPKLKKGADIAAKIDFDPYRAEMERIIEAWLPLTFAVNSINRSMGLSDLYPFVLAPTVIAKLTFVHDRIRARRTRGEGEGALRAMIAGLKQRIGSPGIN